MKTRYTLQSYWRPTPHHLRVIGDTLLLITTAFDGVALLTDFPTIGIIVQVIGVLGKFLTNFSHTDYGK